MLNLAGASKFGSEGLPGAQSRSLPASGKEVPRITCSQKTEWGASAIPATPSFLPASEGLPHNPLAAWVQREDLYSPLQRTIHEALLREFVQVSRFDFHTHMTVASFVPMPADTAWLFEFLAGTYGAAQVSASASRAVGRAQRDAPTLREDR